MTKHSRVSISIIQLMLLLLLLVACGTPQAVSTPPLPTDTPAPTATPLPTNTPVPPTSTPTVTPEPPAWDYVALGDSTVAGVAGGGDYSYATHYAAHIEADLGVKVTLHNKGIPGLRSGELLERIRTDEAWRELIREAEVVTIIIGSNDLGLLLINEYRLERCGGDDNQDCLREALEAFKLFYQAIFDEIRLLCGPEILIRTMTESYGSFKNYGFDGDT